MNPIIYKIRAIVIFIGLLLCNPNLQAQGIDDFGVVWNKTFEYGYYLNNMSIIQTNDPTDKGYLAFGGGLIPTFRKNGIVVEFDEQGNELRKVIYTLPSEAYTPVALDASFSFGMAFKTNDGGILAFGEVLDKQAKADDLFNPTYGWLKQGVIIVKFDKDLNATKVERVRGSTIEQGSHISDGNFLIGGLDFGGIVGSSYNLTLLRKYNQEGVLLLDAQSDYREISFLNENSTVDTYLATTPDRILRIDATNNQLKISSVKLITSLGLPQVEVTNGVSVTPTSDGGYFLNTRLKSHDDPLTNYQNGHGTYRLGATDNIIYYDIQKPGKKIYTTPYLLPGTTSTYIGTSQIADAAGLVYTPHIYELIDGSNFNVRIGIELPKGTSLTRASRSDGFFVSGGNIAEGAIVAKLSSCIKFKINNLPTNSNIIVNHAPNVNVNIPFNFEGAKAATQTDVKYDLQAYVVSGTVNGITPSDNGGELESLSDQTVSSYAGGIGKALDLNRTYTLADGPVVIKYILTIKDSYLTAGIPQSCGQTYVFYLRSVPQSEVVAMPTSKTETSGVTRILTSIKNVGKSSFANPYNITIYKDAVGDAAKFTYPYPNAIVRGETVDFIIDLPNDAQWNGATNLVLNFNDNGDGNAEQPELNQTVIREYKVKQ